MGLEKLTGTSGFIIVIGVLILSIPILGCIKIGNINKPTMRTFVLSGILSQVIIPLGIILCVVGGGILYYPEKILRNT